MCIGVQYMFFYNGNHNLYNKLHSRNIPVLLRVPTELFFHYCFLPWLVGQWLEKLTVSPVLGKKDFLVCIFKKQRSTGQMLILLVLFCFVFH